MATRAVTTFERTCDRPGCDKRCTDKGARVRFDHDDDGIPAFVSCHVPHEDVEGIDLCRECFLSLKTWWMSKLAKADKDAAE